jgi:hypothetical protein
VSLLVKIIRTNVIGIMNTLPEKQYVLFWEFDDIELSEIIEEMNFISEFFDIDIDILESSKKHYHAVSYDILDYNKLLYVQRCIYYSHGHYLDIDEIDLYRNIPKEIQKGNTLRLGKKLGKDEPKFKIRILSPSHNLRRKSLQHFRAYQYFCKVPEFSNVVNIMWYNLKIEFVVFATGISSKSNKQYQTYLQRRINQKIYKLLKTLK